MSALVFPPPVNPNDLGRGPLVVGMCWTFTSLCIIVIALRFYVRRRIHVIGWDDWIMLAAVVSARSLCDAGGVILN